MRWFVEVFKDKMCLFYTRTQCVLCSKCSPPQLYKTNLFNAA